MIIKPKYYGPAIPSTYAITMTAAASGSNGITVANDADFNFGTYDFGAYWEGSLTSVATPATAINFFRTTVAGGLNSSIIVTHANTGDSDPGKVRVIIRNGATAYNYYTTQPLSALASANSVFKMVVSIVRETLTANGSISVYINGALLGSAITIPSGTNFVIGNAVDPLYISGDSASRVASNTVSFAFFNFAPTQSEVYDLSNNGIPSGWRWGSQSAIYTSNFTAGADSWVAVGGAVAGNIDSIGGLDDWLRFTCNSSNSAHAAQRTFPTTTGIRYVVTFTYYVPSSNSNIDGFTIRDNDGAVLYPLITAVLDSATTISILVTVANTNTWGVYGMDGTSAVFTDAGGNDVFYIRGFSAKMAGATMALLPNTIPTSSATTWSDTSGNTGGGTLPAAGATKVTIRR